MSAEIVSERLAVRRARTLRIRKAIAAAMASSFIGFFAVVYIQMAEGRDPAVGRGSPRAIVAPASISLADPALADLNASHIAYAELVASETRRRRAEVRRAKARAAAARKGAAAAAATAAATTTTTTSSAAATSSSSTYYSSPGSSSTSSTSSGSSSSGSSSSGSSSNGSSGSSSSGSSSPAPVTTSQS